MTPEKNARIIFRRHQVLVLPTLEREKDMSDINVFFATLQSAFNAAVEAAVQKHVGELSQQYASAVGALALRLDELEQRTAWVNLDEIERRLSGREDVADRLTDAQLQAIARKINLPELAERIELSELAECIDLSELVGELDYSELAGKLDYGEVGGNVDLSDLADEFDLDRLAEHVDIDFAEQLRTVFRNNPVQIRI